MNIYLDFFEKELLARNTEPLSEALFRLLTYCKDQEQRIEALERKVAQLDSENSLSRPLI